MRHLQVIPKGSFNLYGALVKKERSLRGKGTFYRVKTGWWGHESYAGWVRFYNGFGNILDVEIRSKVENTEWQLLHAFVGFLDRNFADKIGAINIQYA